ncbi:MAG TPA: SDR family NAD(P)-dependent oxidoreductase, partial [Acidimicrobiales bacterium]|nr:SDR family NAD(P)-dependent oxidoreductase [Acidimicrobiales bacterium]
MAEDQTRVALVTGGSKGLGAGLVEAYLDAGYCVETCSRSSTDQVRAWEDDLQRKERFHFATADVSKAEDAERFVKDAAKRWGRIDVLVNNAGVAREGVIGLFA